MFRSCLLAYMLICLLLLPPVAVDAAPSGKPEKPELKAVKEVVKVTRKGEAFCFERAIALGTIVIAGGRCYTFYVVTTAKGSFLGFGPPGPPMIPPGQLVRLGTPAGVKLKGRLFYLVPMPVTVTLISTETIRFVSVQVVPHPGQVVIKVPPTTAGTQEKEIELPFLQR